MSKSSLSSVVSHLVRASMGSSLDQDVPDEDLDRHVADLILKEAKQKGERYSTAGIRAYLNSGSSDSNAPRTNKRFLSSIIKNTDDHNKTILRAQALAAQEVKREREEQEKKERRARAEEATAAERSRRSQGSSRRGESDRWDRNRDSDRDRDRNRGRKRKNRSWERMEGVIDSHEGESDRRRQRDRYHSPADNEDGSEMKASSSKASRRDDESTFSFSSSRRRPHRSHSRSPVFESSEADHNRRRHRLRHSRDRDSSDRRKRRSSRSRSPRGRYKSGSADGKDGVLKVRRRSRSQSPSHNTPREDKSSNLAPKKRRSESPNDKDDGREIQLRLQLKAQYKAGHDKQGDKSPRFQNRTSSPGPKLKLRRESPQLSSSKARSLSSMSRSPSPPPRSDPHKPHLPSKMDKYFEETYDPRLDVAPLSAPKVPTTGLIDNAEFEGWDAMLELIRIRREDREEKMMMEKLGLGKDKDKKNKKGKSIAVSSINDQWRAGSENIMEIEYKKKGSVREWDMGKEGF